MIKDSFSRDFQRGKPHLGEDMKSLKRIIAAALSAMMVLSFTGFTGAASDESVNYRVAYIARSKADTFGNWLANAVEAEAEEIPDITLDVFDGEADNDKQIAFIEDAIAKEYDCIIVQPQNGEVLRPYAEKIVAAGIKLITTNPKIDGITGGSTVDADPYAQAKVNCDLALTLIPENAKVVVLKGPKGNFHADERREAWEKEFFAKRTDVTIVKEAYADWSKDTATALMKEWTAEGETVDAIISMNDDMCVGAIEAIKGNAAYANTLAFGVDGTAEALLLIKEGKMTATCMQNAYELSKLILDTAEKLLAGAEKDINVSIGNPLVTAENVDEYIQMLKKAGAINIGIDGRTVKDVQVYNALYDNEVDTLNYLITTTTNDLVIAANTIDSLVESDSYGKIIPAAAKSWEVSEDGLTWTFHLREGQYWYDKDGKKQEPVTANDFVSAISYIRDPANKSAALYMVDGWVEKAIALDDNTLQYQLVIPRPYFLTALQSSAYWPAPASLLEELGADFGKDNSKLWYNGAYILSSFIPQNEHILTKNLGYWDKDNVHIEKVIDKYNTDAAKVAPDMFIEGEIDYAEITADTLAEWQNDDEKSADLSPMRIKLDYSYFYSFNFEPQFDEKFEPDNWTIAVNNENLRQAIFYGLDRANAMAVSYPADPDNPENPNRVDELLQKSITPEKFAVNETTGKDYVTYGDIAKVWSAENYSETAAKEFRDKAREELTAAGAEFPIKVLFPYNAADEMWGKENRYIAKQLEELLGTDFIDIIVAKSNSKSFLSDIRRSGNYALLKCNWGADFADPETFTSPFAEGNTVNFAYDTTEKLGVNTKSETTMAQIEQYLKLVAAAKTEQKDTEARYEALAKAEAYYINNAFVIPYGLTGGGYQATRLSSFEGEYAPFGYAINRFKYKWVYETAQSAEMYQKSEAAWESGKS
jgi:oligopeptide transport system substrate-binding protein